MVGKNLSSNQRRVVSEIIRLITPLFPGLETHIQASVHADVTDFVASQVEAMPSFLRLPYMLAITTFHLLPIVRYGTHFLGLEQEAKAAYLSFWSNGKIGAMRDFIKLIRSCAVLAYFDHADIRRQLDADRLRSAAVAAGIENDNRESVS
jgi:hypothetical protein